MTRHDPVNNPSHYADTPIECIDAMEAMLSAKQVDAFTAYCLGNAFKYLWRAGNKQDMQTDLRKAVWYIERVLDGCATRVDEEPRPTRHVYGCVHEDINAMHGDDLR